MQGAITDTLLLLGYENYQKTAEAASTSSGGHLVSKTLSLPQLFTKPTESTVAFVVHFLLTRLDARRANSTFRGLYPPKTPVQARDFRQAAVGWLQSTGAFPDGFVGVSLFVSPTPPKVMRFLWLLSSYVFREVAVRDAGIKDCPRPTSLLSPNMFMAQAAARAELFVQRRQAAEDKEQEALKALTLLEKRIAELTAERNALVKAVAGVSGSGSSADAGGNPSVVCDVSDVVAIHTETEELLHSLLKFRSSALEFSGDELKCDDVNNDVMNSFETDLAGLEASAGWVRLCDGINFRGGGAGHLAERSAELEAAEREKLLAASKAAESVEKEAKKIAEDTKKLRTEVEAKALAGTPAGQELPSNRDMREAIVAAVEDVAVVVPGKSATMPSTPSKKRKELLAVTTPRTVVQNRKRAAKRVSAIVNRLQKEKNVNEFLLSLEREVEFEDGSNEDDELKPREPKKSKGNL